MTEILRVDARVEARTFDADLTIHDGDVVAVVGPNGAGKSTLLQLIAGALRPSSGAVTLRDRLLSGERDGVAAHVPPHRRRFSYVEQRALLFPHMTVMDNVSFGPRSRGVGRSKARERAERELAATGLGALGERRPDQLSGGQAQRVSLARALAIDPEVILLDEPFAALDVSVTPALRILVRERLRRRRQTAVIVTHDLLDVVSLANRLVLLEGGRIVADGPVDVLCGAPPTQFLADFVGMNLLAGTAVGETEMSLDVLRGASGERVAGNDAGAAHPGPVLTGAGELVPGQRARAIVAPHAVSLHTERPSGSPRNVLRGEVVHVESRGPVVAVTIGVAGASGHGLTRGRDTMTEAETGVGQTLRADVTPGAVAELNLVPGAAVWAAIKATQVNLYPA